MDYVQHTPEPLGDLKSQSKEFIDELAELLNKHSIENESNTPDYLIAEYLCSHLKQLAETVRQRDTWYGLAPRPGSADHKLVPGPPTQSIMPQEDWDKLNPQPE